MTCDSRSGESQETIEGRRSGKDVADAPHVREGPVRRQESLRSRRDGRGSQDGVERTKAGVSIEQLQPGQQVMLLDGKERGQQVDERATQLGRFAPGAPP